MIREIFQKQPEDPNDWVNCKAVNLKKTATNDAPSAADSASNSDTYDCSDFSDIRSTPNNKSVSILFPYILRIQFVSSPLSTSTLLIHPKWRRVKVKQ